MKILIAEDDFLSRKLLKSYLAPFGEVDIATNGTEAIAAATMAINENQPYDLICLDIMMPEVDGIIALRKIRQMESAHGFSPETQSKIIMTTALSEKERVVEAARAKCDAYLIKPITRSRLVEALTNLGINSATPS